MKTITVPFRRGELWSIKVGPAEAALVVSGDLYNEVDYPYILGMYLRSEAPHPPMLVPVGGQVAVIDSLQRIPKASLEARMGEATAQELASVSGALHRLLGTS